MKRMKKRREKKEKEGGGVVLMEVCVYMCSIWGSIQRED